MKRLPYLCAMMFALLAAPGDSTAFAQPQNSAAPTVQSAIQQLQSGESQAMMDAIRFLRSAQDLSDDDKRLVADTLIDLLHFPHQDGLPVDYVPQSASGILDSFDAAVADQLLEAAEDENPRTRLFVLEILRDLPPQLNDAQRQALVRATQRAVNDPAAGLLLAGARVAAVLSDIDAEQRTALRDSLLSASQVDDLDSLTRLYVGLALARHNADPATIVDTLIPVLGTTQDDVPEWYREMPVWFRSEVSASHGELRTMAADALVTQRPESLRAVPAMIEGMVDAGESGPMVSAFYAIAFSLGEMGPEATPWLIEALDHDNSIVRQGVARALATQAAQIRAQLEPARAAVPGLIAQLNDDNNQVAAQAADALGQIGGPEAGMALLNLARSETATASMRGRGLTALEDCDTKPPETFDVLLQIVAEGTERLPGQALAVIRSMGPAGARAVPRLVEIYEGSNDFDKCSSLLLTFRLMGPDAAAAIPAMHRTLTQPKTNNLLEDFLVRYSADGLGEMGPLAREAVPDLLQLADGRGRFDDLDTRREAAFAVWRIDPGHLDVLLPAFAAWLLERNRFHYPVGGTQMEEVMSAMRQIATDGHPAATQLVSLMDEIAAGTRRRLDPTDPLHQRGVQILQALGAPTADTAE